MRRRALLLFSFSCVGAWQLTASLAHAEEQVAASWTAPKECPSSAELASRTASRLPPDAAVRASGRVTKIGAKYTLTLEIETSSSKGERVLEADSCDALATSAAVVIAMSVAPRRDDPAPAPAPVPAPAPAPAPAPTPAPDTADSPRPPDRAALTIRPDLVVDSGLLPSFGAGGGAAIGLDLLRRRLHLEAHAAAFGSQVGTASSDPSKGASFSLFSGGARACWALTRTVEVSACAGFFVGRLSATGFGAAKVSDGDALVGGPEAGLGVFVPLVGSVGLRGGLSALVPISRQSFVITSRGTVHQPSAVGVRGFFGPELRF